MVNVFKGTVEFLRDGGYTDEEIERMMLEALHGEVGDGSASKQVSLSKKYDATRSQIIRILEDLGIPKNLRGYKYLIEAVVLYKKYEDNLENPSMTKTIYPEVAEIFKTTNNRVERAIRHAIEIGFDHASMDTIKNLFGNAVDPTRSVATNAEMIASISAKLD